jgi:hypothetical protein
MIYILFGTAVEIIHADDVITVLDQSITQMLTQESGAAGDQCHVSHTESPQFQLKRGCIQKANGIIYVKALNTILRTATMKRLSRKALCIAMGACLLWMPATYSLGAKLIEPTRALEGENQQPGTLSIFSEPPGLGVTLDGKSIGKTPLTIDSMSQGTHILRVENKETKITIDPGEARRVSFFKDALVELPVEEKATREAPTAAEKQPVHVSGSQQAAENGQTLEPGYFPLNPRGPIY